MAAGVCARRLSAILESNDPPMERLTCDYCRLPFRSPRRPEVGTKVFCCSGCALASQLGIDGERFPVTPQLVFDLVFGFGVFNQGLLGLLALALQREGRGAGAGLCCLIAVALGALLYLAALAWQWRSGWLRASDGFVFALAAGPVIAGGALTWAHHGGIGAALTTGATLGLVAWSTRGFLRRWWARKRA